MQIDLRRNVWRSFSSFLRNDSFHYLLYQARSHEVFGLKFDTINTLHTVHFDSNDDNYTSCQNVSHGQHSQSGRSCVS